MGGFQRGYPNLMDFSDGTYLDSSGTTFERVFLQGFLTFGQAILDWMEK